MRKIVLCLFAATCSLSFSNVIYANLEQADATDLQVNALINPNQSFFIGAGFGVDWLSYGQSINSLYYTPYPYFDYYTANKPSATASFTADFGYRWASELAYSLGISYEHVFSNKLNQNLLVLDNPTFAYNVNSNISSNVLMLFGKIDLARLWCVAPYARVGVGFSSNTFNSGVIKRSAFFNV